MANSKNLRRPITTEVDGVRLTLVGIGHCARAVGRSSTRLKQWEQLGIFPPAPYRSLRDRRRLYPTEFVRSIRIIAEQDYFGSRLERADWSRFQSEVWSVHDATLASSRDRRTGVGDCVENRTVTSEGQ
jgi:hypothetical protein